MPRREAVSRSMTDRIPGRFCCWSELTSAITELCSSAWTSCGVHLNRSVELSACSVYWYCALLCRPPARISCTATRNSRPPGTWASFGRSRAMTCIDRRPLRNRLQRHEDRAGIDLAEAAAAADAGIADDVLHRRVLPARSPSSAAAFASSAETRRFGRLAASRSAVRCPPAEKIPSARCRTARYSGRSRRRKSTARSGCAATPSRASARSRQAPDRTRPLRRRVCRAGVGAQEQRAHHRRGGQRDRQRYDDGQRQRQGEFAKQPAENAAHQQDRDEHRDQRQADRQHGESDLARAEQAPPADAASRPRDAGRCFPARRWHRRPRSRSRW